jgi:hypothetical protein
MNAQGNGHVYPPSRWTACIITEIAEVSFIKTGIVDEVHTKNCADLILVRTFQHT